MDEMDELTEQLAETHGIDPDSEMMAEFLEYLDDLRESGVTNMYGASPYLEEQFDLGHKAAGDVLIYWMRTFSERHRVE